jgi:hypothetical protein
VRRVPAAEIEALVGRAIREHLEDSTPTDDRDLISTHVVRIEVQSDQLAVELKAPKQRQNRGRGNGSPPDRESSEQDTDRTVLHIPWRKDTLETAARDHCAKVRSAPGYSPYSC